MKWFLKVCMARSTVLTHWFGGLTNCYLYLLVLVNALVGAVAWLSVTLNAGV